MTPMNDCVPRRCVGRLCSYDVYAYQRVPPVGTLAARPVEPSSSEGVTGRTVHPGSAATFRCCNRVRLRANTIEALETFWRGNACVTLK